MSDIFKQVEQELAAGRNLRQVHRGISMFALAVLLGAICVSAVVWFGGGWLGYQAYIHRHEVAAEAGRLTKNFEDGVR